MAPQISIVSQLTHNDDIYRAESDNLLPYHIHKLLQTK